MTPRRGLLLLISATLALAPPALGADVGTLLGLTGPQGQSLGPWEISTTEVIPSDLLVLPDPGTPPIPVPHQTPYVFARITPQTGATDTLALVFSDAPVTCTDPIGTFPLQTSFAAILTASDTAALAAYGASIAETGADPAGLTTDPLQSTGAAFVTLPSGARFPGAYTGFEGDFPLYAFYDAQGSLTALAGLFGLDNRHGPDLPSCSAPTS